MPWHFLVVDGADARSVFPLPEQGVLVIGRSHQEVDIYLNDLFVGRVHCQVEVTADGKIKAKHLYGSSGSFVNKVKIDEQELQAGDILRVGNTQMRLDAATEWVAPPQRPRKEAAPAAPTPQNVSSADGFGALQGKTLGHYTIDQQLALNKWRAVYTATDQKTGQTVALKLLAPEFPATGEELQRFTAAMRQALPLRHEHIAALNGVGKTGPLTWIAREHVPGESVSDVLQRLAVTGRTRPKWVRGLRLAVEVARALDYLHGQHVLHGHIHPSNLLIHADTKEVKLTNLLLTQGLTGSRLATAMTAGRRPQDVAYLAPEQCDSGAFVDNLCDIYSLGAVVYARLTGRPPFLLDRTADTLELIRIGPLVRPRQLNSTIPEEFDAIVVKMLERHQEDRFPNAAALLDALQPFTAELAAQPG